MKWLAAFAHQSNAATKKYHKLYRDKISHLSILSTDKIWAQILFTQMEFCQQHNWQKWVEPMMMTILCKAAECHKEEFKSNFVCNLNNLKPMTMTILSKATKESLEVIGNSSCCSFKVMPPFNLVHRQWRQWRPTILIVAGPWPSLWTINELKWLKAER